MKITSTYMPGTIPELSRTCTYYKKVETLSVPCCVCGKGVLLSHSKVTMGLHVAHLECCKIEWK